MGRTMRSESVKATVERDGLRRAAGPFRRNSTARGRAGPNGCATDSGACRGPAGIRLGRLLTGVLAASPAHAQDRETARGLGAADDDGGDALGQRVGLRWRFMGSGAESLELRFEAARRLPANDDPENRLGVSLTARW